MIGFDEILNGLRKISEKLRELEIKIPEYSDDLYVLRVFLEASIKQLEEYEKKSLITQHWK